jgi:hypothetical protein
MRGNGEREKGRKEETERRGKGRKGETGKRRNGEREKGTVGSCTELVQIRIIPRSL